MNDRFRDRLLKMEQVTPALRERYDKEIQAMLEKPLTGVCRWTTLIWTVMGLGAAILGGTVAIIAPSPLPLTGRIGLAAGALLGIGFAVMGLRIVWRGSINLRTETAAYAALAWILPVILVTLLMVSAPDSIVGLRRIICGLVFLVMGAMFLIRHVVEQSELKTREKLLEIEYRLAELAEQMQVGKPKA